MKKIRIKIIKLGINVIKQMYNLGLIDQGQAINYSIKITTTFGKKEENHRT